MKTKTMKIQLMAAALFGTMVIGNANAQEWREVYAQTFDDLSTTGIVNGGLMGGGTSSGRYITETEFSPAAWFDNKGRSSFTVSATAFANTEEWKMTFKFASEAKSTGEVASLYLKKDGTNQTYMAASDFCTVDIADIAENELTWYDVTLVGSSTNSNVTMTVTDGTGAYATGKTVGSGFFNIDELGFYGGNLIYLDEIRCYIVAEESDMLCMKNEAFNAIPANATGFSLCGIGGIAWSGNNKTGYMPLYYADMTASKWELKVQVAMVDPGRAGIYFKTGDTDKIWFATSNATSVQATNGTTTTTGSITIDQSAPAGGDADLHLSTITLVGDKNANTITISAVDNMTDETVIESTIINDFCYIDNIGTWAARNSFVYLSDVKFKVSTDATVAISVGTAGKATYCTDLALDFSAVDGLTAYVATESGNNTVTMQPINAVPGAEGLLVRANETLTEPATYQIPIAETAEAVVTNFLKGLLVATVVKQTDGDNNNYFLTANGFAPAARGDNDEGTTLGGNKAYLSLPTATGQSLAITYRGEGTTEVVPTIATESIKTDAVYDLYGRRVINPVKGLYIVNGKKVFFN